METLVNIAHEFKKLIVRGVNSLSGRASLLLRRPRVSSCPLADRLLADALRLTEIPPSGPGHKRAEFIVERLRRLDLTPHTDERGRVFVRLPSLFQAEEPPLLFFADPGSDRWSPLESLARLDAETARGAGLADSLGAAALLSAAESLAPGLRRSRRDILLLFAACSGERPGEDAFLPAMEEPAARPCAAIGIRGFSLGSVTTHVRGTYRLGITLVQDNQENPGKYSTAVMDTLLSAASGLSGIVWDTTGTTRLFIRRIEAGTSFSRSPREAAMEVDLESSDGALLDMAVNTVKATVENAGRPGLKIAVNIVSFIPVGNRELSEGLVKTVTEVMKAQRLKVNEEAGPDVSAFFSSRGIPALSLGIALGQEGRILDTVRIDSIERGRTLLMAVIDRLCGAEP
jgi:hypothetical protein